MNFINIFLLVFALNTIEINCGVTSLYPKISKFKEQRNESSVDRMKNPSTQRGNSSNRSARFLGKLALVVGVGNKLFETNLTRPTFNFSLNSYSPYVAAVYEPFLSGLQSYIPFKWLFNSSPPNYDDTTTMESPDEVTNFVTELTEISTVSKVEQIGEVEYKIIIDQDNETEVNNGTQNDKQLQGDIEADAEYLSSTSQPMKNEDLFFHHNGTTTENIEVEKEKPVTKKPADVPTTTIPPRRPRPPATPHPRPPTPRPPTPHPPTPHPPTPHTPTPHPRPHTPRPMATTIKHRPTTIRPTKRPVTPPSVTQHPTFPAITSAFTTGFSTETTEANFDGSSGTGHGTEFPGYYGGYPQDVNDLHLTTLPTPNDYSDIRDRLTNDYNDYVNNYDNYDNRVNYVPGDVERAPEKATGIQYFYQPSKIVIQDKFRPNGDSPKAWNYDYRLNHFV